MPSLSYDEIKDGNHFEELVAAYFNSLKSITGTNVTHVEVFPSGIGPDHGVDIIVEFIVTDLIKEFKRKWIVQCKFLNRNIKSEDISDIYIPQLIYSYGACGYLLICKQRPTNKLVTHFKNLNLSCKEKYSYEIWTGEEFKGKLYSAPQIIHQQFFTRYFDELKLIDSKIEK